MAEKIELQAPNLKHSEIKLIADNLVREYLQKNLPDFEMLHGIEFNHFYETILRPKYGVEIIEDLDLEPTPQGVKRLGTYLIPSNLAVIGLPPSHPQRTWTLWHEAVGHGVLHGPYFRDHFQNTQSIDVTEFSMSSDALLTIERQANLLAAHVAAPQTFVAYWIKRVFGVHNFTRPIRYHGPMMYSLRVNGADLQFRAEDYFHLCRFVASKIKTFFGGMSVESLAYRVKETGLIRDYSRRKASCKYKIIKNKGLHLDRVAG